MTDTEFKAPEDEYQGFPLELGLVTSVSMTLDGGLDTIQARGYTPRWRLGAPYISTGLIFQIF